MNQRELFLIRIQHVIGRFAVFVTAPLLVLLIRVFGYRIKNLKKMRRTINDLFKTHKGPWIICANHLTMVDSLILAYAMFPFYRFMFQYRLVPWNIPEKHNFNQNILLTISCYLLKCIPVVRGGNRDKIHSFLMKCSYLLEKGENLMIFPEGTRSRTGHIVPENVSYGVGRLISQNPDCRVLCLYLRGDRQKTYSMIPKFNESFFLSADTIQIEIESKGLKAQRAYAQTVIAKLTHMEKMYFETCRQ